VVRGAFALPVRGVFFLVCVFFVFLLLVLEFDRVDVEREKIYHKIPNL